MLKLYVKLSWSCHLQNYSKSQLECFIVEKMLHLE